MPTRDFVPVQDLNELAPGDVVQLRTGGPEMTVERLDAAVDKVACVWFSPDGDTEDSWDGPQRDSFYPRTLDRYVEE